jgi:serine/threonine protein kinase
MRDTVVLERYSFAHSSRLTIALAEGFKDGILASSDTVSIDLFEPGTRVGGRNDDRFEVKKKVGQGAQGLVVLAEDHKLQRLVALKVCTAAGGLQRKEFLRRFDRELKLTSRVNHPHVLNIYDCDETQDGTPYVVLEWMARGALDRFAERTRKAGQHTPLPYVGYYAAAIATGLRAAHAREIIHRDIKPDNVLVNDEGVAKLTDFGIAKDISEGAVPLTEMGMALGTLGFMAPEQLRGLPVPQSDIFSLGVTIYALVTGKVLPQTKKGHIPLGLPLDEAWEGLPADLVALLKRFTAPKLDDRAETMKEVLNHIEEVNWNQVLGPSCPLEQLPPLPSGAFTTGATTAINSVADVPVPGSSGQSLVLSTDEIVELSTGDIGVLEPTSVEPAPPGETRIQTPSSLAAEFPAPEPRATPAPEPEPEPVSVTPEPEPSSVAPVAEEAEAEGPGSTTLGVRVSTGKRPSRGESEGAASSSQVRESSKGQTAGLVGRVGLAVAVAFAVAVALVLGSRPSPVEDRLAALQGFNLAVAAGSWEAAAASVSGLTSSTSTTSEGALLRATEKLLAGDPSDAASLPMAGVTGGAPWAAQAGFLRAAGQRLSSVAAYAGAAETYQKLMDCGTPECEKNRDRVQRGLREVCFVAGSEATQCATTLSGVPERTQKLAASLVLSRDGHSEAAGERLREVLPGFLSDPEVPTAMPTCTERELLHSWAQEPAPEGAMEGLRAAAVLAARGAADCALFKEESTQ